MAENYKKSKNRHKYERLDTKSSIGLYEMLSQSENDVNSEYSSIIDKMEEISQFSDKEYDGED